MFLIKSHNCGPFVHYKCLEQTQIGTKLTICLKSKYLLIVLKFVFEDAFYILCSTFFRHETCTS